VSTSEPLGDEHFDRLIEKFLAPVAEEFLGLGIDEDDPAVLVDNHHGVGGRFEHGTKPFLRLLAPGDVSRSGKYP
jgi:hypothetical protein